MLIETAQDAAEIPVVQAELGSNFPGRWFLAVCELVKHAGFGERVWAFQKVVAQDADPARVGPVETADGADMVEGMAGHARPQSRICGSIK